MRMSLGANIALLLTVAVLATAGIGVLLWWTLGHPSVQGGAWTAANSFDFAKVVLAIVGGIGAVVALVVAYRKQHLGEAAELREDAKLFSERFTKAADQLGSDKAAVRLAGIYALEGLAQGEPDQRQTIVDVLCAYLRMPYIAADTLDYPTAFTVVDDHTDAQRTSDEQKETERREQERQVRLTAQRILAAHLHPGETKDRAAETFWGKVNLDLTGATLVDLDLSRCHIHTAQFSRANFVGRPKFNETQFTGNAWFNETQFTRGAIFDRAQFTGDAWFERAQFTFGAWFNEAQFTRNAWFSFSQFDSGAEFKRAQFANSAEFKCAQFNGEPLIDTTFREAHFAKGARFDEAKFTGRAGFVLTQFTGPAWFDGAQFSAGVYLDSTEFASDAMFNRAQFTGQTSFRATEFAGGAGFSQARFTGRAEFKVVRVRLDVPPDVARCWMIGYTVTEPLTAERACLLGREGRWGYLTRSRDTTRYGLLYSSEVQQPRRPPAAINDGHPF